MPDTNNAQTSSELLSKIHNSVKEAGEYLLFDVNKFIHSWYTWGGGSYYFLFRNSLDTTDIQFSELVSLIRMNSYSAEDGSQVFPFQFNSSKEFKQRLESLWESLGKPRKDERELTENFYGTYYNDLFGSTILVDCYYGSAVVHVPKTLTIKPEMICAESGYIYACGKAIYVRKTSKLGLLEDLENKLQIHLDSRGTEDSRKTLFTTFSHEQFFEEPKPYILERQRLGLVPGLTKEREDIKVYLSKYYFGDLHITDVLEKLNQNKQFSGRLYVSEQKPF
jgi:hypothetical protein